MVPAVTDEPLAAYIRRLHERFEREREEIRTRSIALGYAFGRADQRLLDGREPPEDNHGTAFADFYEQHNSGTWTDLGPQYAAFQTRKDSSSE